MKLFRTSLSPAAAQEAKAARVERRQQLSQSPRTKEMVSEQASLIVHGYVRSEEVSDERYDGAEAWARSQTALGLGVEAVVAFQKAEDQDYEDPNFSREELYARAAALASLSVMLPEMSDKIVDRDRQHAAEFPPS